MPGEANIDSAAKLTHQLEHPLPFGEDQHFHVRVVAAFFENFLQFGEFGAGAVFGIEDIIGIAIHAHHGQVAEQSVLLRLGQRAPSCQRSHFRDDQRVFLVCLPLL